MTPQERLHQARNRTRAKRDELNHVRQQGSTLKRKFADGGNPSEADHRELARLGSESDRLSAEYLECQAEESAALRALDGRSTYGSMGVLADPETVQTLESWATTSAQLQNTNIGEILSREETVHLTGRAVGGPFAALTPGTVTVPDEMRTAGFGGVVPLLQAPLT